MDVLVIANQPSNWPDLLSALGASARSILHRRRTGSECRSAL